MPEERRDDGEGAKGGQRLKLVTGGHCLMFFFGFHLCLRGFLQNAHHFETARRLRKGE